MSKNDKSPTGGQTSGTDTETTVSNTIPNTNIGDSADKVKAAPKKDVKARAWWAVVYPESAPPNWRELVQETLIEAFISPLHDNDINPNGNGEKKKPHYHVVLDWPGPTTYSNARDVMASFGGSIQPKAIASLRGAVRYLCHLDNPEKAPYSQDDVICYNGADYLTVINLQTDKYNSIAEMMDFVSKYHITSFKLLNDYARKNRNADWFRQLCDGASYVMSKYIRSVEYEIANNAETELTRLEELISKGESIQVDNSTGEVISPDVLSSME